ncbi:MAG: 50S ribosomal protein L11 methyltransferase [Pseudomonadota bacterium]
MTDSPDTSGFEVAVQVRESEIERTEGALLGVGAVSLTLTDAGNHPLLEPAPGATPLWPETVVTGFFTPDAELESVLAGLRALAVTPSATRAVGAADWVRAWMDDFQPMAFGERLWIVPTHCEIPSDADIALRLDPGLAFGTGTHPTTALCLEFLDGMDLEGRRVLDFGCGSGVLAVAAALLGAPDVVAIDIDPQAEIATRENAARNGVADRVHIEDLATVGPHNFSVIVANILAGALVELAPVIGRLADPGARVALSGILVEQVPIIRSAYAGEFTDFEVHSQGDWALVTAVARDF